ncbi:16S rRNA (adenine(1518)-N(6)/adenine(1519)-N(6))-dimethyltransferase RsmA [Sphingomicrobium aestuariivivum]|uniref:16S rRNA (adenine(1518)-N(6)/adenine(1519)-N(6))- dimethyltransferase RsmA n=1 Tax=Sphingomicrobium aestuariivivum TaxID=1582356 RepID=UPI001FD6FB81|nr:16S rRNA (adenine(1518)-N(6)/adenine(1519)-N(6))-dimethyltransferase RsmA [Sphingomicrobium aestuariivivum]MCJ8190039.1 16S rRNA (adenine(1518)-N(6)/adenine(1519)-N(6))-dimethyltransferase RsmA [Sphingomicrobium aestuariivivum]
MSEIEPLREVIARHGLRADKALGQNFILDRQLLARIAALLPGKMEGASVFEVGPGPGGLTRALLDTGANVVAVERDRRTYPLLSELSEEYGGKLRVIEGDALKVDPSEEIDGPYHIAANLPYNIGTQLLTNWLESEAWPPRWQSLTLMFQLEVAQRIVAKPGSSAYGRLSVLGQWRSTPQIAMKLSRSAFVPPPKVASAVVHIVPAEQPEGVEPKQLSKLTAAAFGQRRKMLRQSLKGMPGALEALEKVGIDPTRRAETVSVDEFVELARAL